MADKTAHIIITRVDNIGDVVLTLPMAGLLKQHYPNCKITLMARSYTKSLAEACSDIDNFVDWEKLQTLPELQIISELAKLRVSTIIHLATNNREVNKRIIRLAKKAGIPNRIGRLESINNIIYCNKLVSQRRHHSNLHEAQLNLKLLKPLGINCTLAYPDLAQYINLKVTGSLPTAIAEALDEQRFNLIIHPGSQGHGREWPMEHFKQFILSLPPEQYKVFITGTDQEQQRFQELIDACPHSCNMMGKMSLEELMIFISRADGLIASGTGPLHLAAAFGINTLGLFPPRASINPQRWAPVGKKAHYLVFGDNKIQSCVKCDNNAVCQCMLAITVGDVWEVVRQWQATNQDSLSLN